MGTTTMSAEADTDGEAETQDTDAETQEVEEEFDPESFDASDAEFITPHGGMTKRAGLKIGVARLYLEEVMGNDDIEVVYTEAPVSVFDGQQLALSEGQLDDTQWVSWSIHLMRIVCMVDNIETEEPVPVFHTEVDGDAYLETEEEYFPGLVDMREVISVGSINEVLRDNGHHPEQYYVDAPEPTSTRGPRSTVRITPAGTELSGSDADDFQFDPKTGDDLSEVDLMTEEELAELSGDERDDYFQEGVEVDIPEPSDEEDEEEAEAEAEAEAEPADEDFDEDAIQALVGVSGVGEKTAEKLLSAGYESPEEVEEASADELTEAGIGAGQVSNIKREEEA